MKSEIRILTSYNPVQGFSNGNFEQYAEKWSGVTNIDSVATYVPLRPNEFGTAQTYAAISLPQGWTWYNNYLYSTNGSTDPVYQELSGLGVGKNYRIQFTVTDNYGGGTLTPYLYGFSGSTINSGGTHTQYIYIANTGATVAASGSSIMFMPSSGFTGGISKIIIGGGTPLETQLGGGLNPGGEEAVLSYDILDLYEEDNFALTFQIQSNLSNKSSTYSKTIKIPGTTNNNQVFNNLFDIGRYLSTEEMSEQKTIFLNKKLRAGIYIDSVEILFGFLELTKVIKSENGVVEYECIFYSNLKTIADTIGEKLCAGNDNKLDDLDFSEYDHYHLWSSIYPTWKKSGITPTWAKYWLSKGVYYPVIDYANIQMGNIYRLENFKPALYVKEIWDKIFTKAGFSYTSTFLESDLFKSLVHPAVGTLVEHGLDFENSKFKVGRTGTQSWSIQNGQGYRNGRIDFNYTGGSFFNSYDASTGAPTYDLTNSWWLVDSSIVANLYSFVRFGIRMYTDTAGILDDKHRSMTVFLRLVRIRNNQYQILTENSVRYDYERQVILSLPEGYPLVYSGITVSENQKKGEIDAAFDNADCYRNDKFIVEIQWGCDMVLRTEGGGYIDTTTTLSIAPSIPETSELVPTLFMNDPVNQNYYLEGSKVFANDALPRKMKQIDFIKAISNKFNLMFCEDKANPNNLFIEPWDTFFTGTTLDWTQKIDYSKNYEFERADYLLDKDVNFKLKDDSNDMLLKNYKERTQGNFGDRFIKNIYYSNGKEVIEDGFSSSFLGSLGATNWTVSKIFKEQDDYDKQIPTEGDFNYRIMYRDVMLPSNCNNMTFTEVNVKSIDLTYTGSTTGTTVLKLNGVIRGGYPYAGFLDNPYYPTIDFNYGRAAYYLHQSQTVTDNNLSWAYWRNKLTAYLDLNSKVLTCYMFLNHTDIAKLDFRKYVIIDGHKYMLMKIMDWVPMGSSKVQLLQIQPLEVETYLDPYTTQVYSPPNGGGGGGGVVGGGVPPQRRFINLQPAPSLEYYTFSDSGSTYTDNGDDISYTVNGYTMADKTNYYSDAAVGIIIGEGNTVEDNNTFVKGNYNTIKSNNNTILDSHYNEISTDNVVLIKSDYNIIGSGVTAGVLLQTSGLTITSDNKVYIKNKDADTLADTTYVATISASTLADSKTYTNTISGITIKEAKDYTDTVSGNTITYVDSNFATKSGIFNIDRSDKSGSTTDFLVATNQNFNIATAANINGKTYMIVNTKAGSISISARNSGDIADKNATLDQNCIGIVTYNGTTWAMAQITYTGKTFA